MVTRRPTFAARIAGRGLAEGALAPQSTRALGRAERRPHAALKALIVLRRLRGPGVGVQVNVAGAMVVDNRGG